MYANGRGVIKNNREAYIWFSLAVASGWTEEYATIDRNKVEQRLSRDQRAEAQKEAERRWKEIAERQANKTKGEP